MTRRATPAQLRTLRGIVERDSRLRRLGADPGWAAYGGPTGARMIEGATLPSLLACWKCGWVEARRDENGEFLWQWRITDAGRAELAAAEGRSGV
jgi:hypothetical protein